MKNLLIVLCIVLGILCLFLAWVYWTTPANVLPSYLPGFNPALNTTHIKHGVGAFILGLGFFILAWFESGKKR